MVKTQTGRRLEVSCVQMIKALIALALVSMIAVLLWYAKDYGTVDANLDHATDQIEINQIANEERKEIQQADNASVMQAIDNKALRDHHNQVLKQQATDHERELEKTRSNVATLSTITIERMQQYAAKNSPRKQLGTR